MWKRSPYAATPSTGTKPSSCMSTARFSQWCVKRVSVFVWEMSLLYRARKTHPGPVVHLSDNPLDPNKVSSVLTGSSMTHKSALAFLASCSVSSRWDHSLSYWTLCIGKMRFNRGVFPLPLPLPLDILIGWYDTAFLLGICSLLASLKCWTSAWNVLI